MKELQVGKQLTDLFTAFYIFVSKMQVWKGEMKQKRNCNRTFWHAKNVLDFNDKYSLNAFICCQ